MLVYPKPRRQRDIAYKGAPPRLAAHQPHRLQLGVDTRRGRKRHMVLRGETPVRRQLRACRQLTATDRRGITIDQGFVARFHRNVSMTIF